MAIEFETEKKASGLFGIVATFVVFAIILIIVYILFFKKPEILSNITAPQQLSTVNSIAQIKQDPSSIINSPVFMSLHNYASNLTMPTAGRANPFQPF
ncbi:MAG: hypothetical protein ACP5IC_00740 [Minisyncoccia bacterium]